MSDDNPVVEAVEENPVVEPVTEVTEHETPESQRPPWVDDIVTAIADLKDAVTTPPTEVAHDTVEHAHETVEHVEHDETPVKLPWTHRGFKG